VRGLTTAATVWVVAALGVLFGSGLFIAGAAATAIAWVALELLRQLEDRVPIHALVHCEIGFPRDQAPDEARVVELVSLHGFKVTELASTLDASSQLLEYQLAMWSTDSGATRALERTLRTERDVVSFRLVPTRD
jgi:putative Mg2+ transporter-C (MgtC) family protein